MTYYKELILEISGEGNPKMHAKQGDQNSRFVLCTLQKDGVYLPPTDITEARVAITKPDNTQILADCSLPEGQGIVFALTPQMLAIPGEAKGELLLFEEDTLLSSCPFTIEIIPQAFDQNRLQSSDEYSALLNVLSDVRAAIAWCDESAKNAARCASLADSAAAFLSKRGYNPSLCLPIGSLLPFAGAFPPQGFFLCDGAQLSKHLYANLFSIIGERYGKGKTEDAFCLPRLQEDGFSWMIAVGSPTIDYAAYGLSLDLDRVDNTRRGENLKSDCWEDLCGGLSLYLSKEERDSFVLSDEHCDILSGYLKRAATAELATPEGTLCFLREGNTAACFHDGKPIPSEEGFPNTHFLKKSRLFAVRLYDRPLIAEERIANAQTDHLRFSERALLLSPKKGGSGNVL